MSDQLRNVWCINLKPEEVLGRVPTTYRPVAAGTERRPGLYGEGIAGELLVSLLPEDPGEWFPALACASPGPGCRHEAQG